jgi:hypothetical protein
VSTEVPVNGRFLSTVLVGLEWADRADAKRFVELIGKG